MNPTRRQRLFFALLVMDAALIAFILTRSLKPAAASDAESGRILTLLQAVFPGITMHFVRKLAHFTEFFALGGLLELTCAVRRRPMLLWPLLGGALVACTDETIQRFVEGRSGELKDAALDSAGVLCAVLLVWLLLRLREKRKKQACKKSRS